MRIFSTNKKAHYEYSILDTFEAGIVLFGDEVKSIRSGNVRLAGSYAVINDGLLNLLNCHIAKYPFAFKNYSSDELRTRKLLVHRHELIKIIGKVSRKGIILVPIKIYANNRGYIKIEIGLGKHKKLHDRKNELKEKDIDKSARRELKGKYDY